MPPQLTDISPGIGADAARRGLTLSIVQAKGAIDHALAERLKASAAALDGALPDKEAAGPRRGILGLLSRYWRVFRQRHQSTQVSLHDLSDRELMDIGPTRGEVDYLSPQRAIDNLRDSTRYLWNRGGI